MASPDRITILTYHSIDESDSVVSVAPDRFRRQMKLLASLGVKCVTLAAAREARRRDGHWPADAVVLTFDDGYANVHEHALPVLAEHGFAATVFVISGHAGGQNDWGPRPPRLPALPLATWDQVGQWQDLGWEIGAHTHTHPDLRGCLPEEIQRQFQLCDDALTRHIGRRPRSFAYPFGWYSRDAARLAAERYEAAVTTRLARAGQEAAHLLPRVDMYYVGDDAALEALVRGRRDGYLAVRRLGRWVKSWLS